MLPLVRRGLTALTVSVTVPVALALPASATDAGPGNPSPGRSAATGFSSTATCPAGQKVVSGGFEGRSGDDVIASFRSAPDAWTVTSAYQAVQASAVCSSTIRPTRVTATGTFPTNTDEKLALTARCPSGQRPVAGGWAYGNDDTTNSPVFTSRPVLRGWKVRAFADAGDQNSLSVFAYCAPVETDVRSGAGEPVAGDGTAGATASCPSATTALGGGFSTTPKSDFSNNDGPDFFYYVSQPAPERSWTVQATNYGSDDVQANAIAYLVCGV